MSEIFDKEDIYDSEISPLMKRVISICKEHKIPMLCSFNYENHKDNGQGYCTTNLFFDERESDELNEANSIIRKGANSFMAMAIVSGD